MTATRRALLAALGLAPAGAVSAETFLDPGLPRGELDAGTVTKATQVNALRRMADLVESGAIMMHTITAESHLMAQEIPEHRMVFKFYYSPGPDA